MSKITTKKETMELSADDLALVSAIVLVIGDLVAVFSILKARTEDKDKR